MLKKRLLIWFVGWLCLQLLPHVGLAQDEELPDFTVSVSDSLAENLKRFKALLELSQSVEQGQTARSLRYAEDALELGLKMGDSVLVAHCYNRMGLIMKHAGDHTNALQFYVQAIALYEHNGHNYGRAVVSNNIGRLYFSQKYYQQAAESYNQAISLKKTLLDASNSLLIRHYQQSLATTYSNMGMAELMLGEADAALHYLELSLDIYRQLGDTEGQADVMTKKGQVRESRNQFDEAQKLYEEGLALREREGKKSGLSDSYIHLGNFYLHKGLFSKSRAMLLEGMSLSLLLGDKEKQLQVYYSLSLLEEKVGDSPKALQYFKKYDDLKDSLFNQERTMLIADTRIKYETEKKERENELLRKEQTIREDELKIRKWQIWGSMIGIAFVAIVAILLYRSNTESKRANRLLFEQNILIHQKREEIAAQKEDIEEKNEKLEQMNESLALKNERITDSLIYGQSVQGAVLPSLANFREHFDDAFAIYRPKDIVSGDFYWLARTRNKVFLAVADCTGHGVPGAFMSLLGYAFLHEIIVVKKFFSTNTVLENLHETIVGSLHQREGINQDGMTIALCAFERSFDGTVKASFSGAKMDMLHCSEGKEPQLIEGDRLSLGGDVRAQGPKHFSKKKIEMKAGDHVYFFSDGYPDQCNTKWRRFGSAKLIELISRNCHLDMEAQQQLLESTLDKHQGNMEQRDDITVVGIRL